MRLMSPFVTNTKARQIKVFFSFCLDLLTSASTGRQTRRRKSRSSGVLQAIRTWAMSSPTGAMRTP